MKKVLILGALGLMACNGRHLAWVTDKATPKKELFIPELNTELAGVQFTFDDGPDLAKTSKILDILKKYKLQATFFVEGINLAGESEAAKERRALLTRAREEGHIIGNHTFDHKDLCKLPPEKAAWELDTTTDLITKTITGTPTDPHPYRVLKMRPPYGKKCHQLNKLLAQRNLKAMYWDIDPREWERDPKTHHFKTSDQVVDGIMAQYYKLHNEQGVKHMVIILHDTKQVTVELLPKLLDKLSKEK